jgi:hypothetical protein
MLDAIHLQMRIKTAALAAQKWQVITPREENAAGLSQARIPGSSTPLR